MLIHKQKSNDPKFSGWWQGPEVVSFLLCNSRATGSRTEHSSFWQEGGKRAPYSCSLFSGWWLRKVWLPTFPAGRGEPPRSTESSGRWQFQGNLSLNSYHWIVLNNYKLCSQNILRKLVSHTIIILIINNFHSSHQALVWQESPPATTEAKTLLFHVTWTSSEIDFTDIFRKSSLRLASKGYNPNPIYTLAWK